MKLKLFILPAVACGAAAFLLAPTQTRGYATIPGTLNLNQRDFRVYNNFSDASANNNTTPDPMFPGWQGADMAVWKGVIEWGSEAHGDGSGDPTQTVLGSGQANFDSTWQGSATGSGGTNENIVSARAGGTGSCSGATLAYTELPISDGWRIFFCENITWADGPGTISGSQFDIQEVMCHEYGHALGLGHSAVTNATMYAATSAGSISGRSLHNDDRDGVQFKYGIASAGKPHIASVTGVNNITITGSNFDAVGNEVWFTRGSGTSTGTPVKVTNVASSSGGTVITVTKPTDAGSGDILVKIGGTAHDKLSNAYPYDASAPEPVTYCSGKWNSENCVPYITWTGMPSVSSTTPFRITGNDIVANATGFMLYTPNGRSNLTWHNATLCVKSPFVRYYPAKNSGNTAPPPCTGEIQRNFNNVIQAQPYPFLTAGQQINAQYYYRDVGVDAWNDGLTDGIEFVIQP